MILSRRSILAGGAAFLAMSPLRGATMDDKAIVRRAFSLLHPGLFRYNSPAQMDARFRDFDRQWENAPDLAGRYLSLSRLLAGIRCGHSYANFYNQKAAVVENLFSGRNRLPFRFRWIGDQMIVTDGPLPRGSVVDRIDGRHASDILRTLMPLTRADGSNDGKRRQLLSISDADDFETFDILYPLVFQAGDSFDIQAKTPSGEIIHANLAALDLKARQASRKGRAVASADAPIWSIAHDGRSSILTMDGWAVYNSRWDWRAWLDAVFEDLARRKTNHLIIDIRRNEGGLDCGAEIIAHLIDAPFPVDTYARRVRYTRIPDDLAPYCDTWDPSFKDWGADATPYDARYYTLKGDSDGPAIIQPKGPRFQGRVVVLTSATNSSATFQFAQQIKQARLGTLVGSQTGGNQRGINGGAFFFLRLPESGLEADLPLIGYFPDGPRPDLGILPDIPVVASAKDIGLGRDPVLSAAQALKV
jgi:hypothetical protein